MELLALVLINIFLAIIMYYMISIKVQSIVKDFQDHKLKKEIQTLAIDFYKESENYLALMDSRITSLKNLLQKADSMGIQFDSEIMKSSKQSFSSFETKQKEVLKPTQEEKYSTDLNESGVENLLTGIGKGFKSLLGISTEEENKKKNFSQIQKKPSINFSVGGNPLLDKSYILDKNDKESFQSNLNEATNQSKKDMLFDKVQINALSALKELPESASKVDKVVHLLKKGFTHIEISEATGLAIPEISLIETIKIDRSKKF